MVSEKHGHRHLVWFGVEIHQLTYKEIQLIQIVVFHLYFSIVYVQILIIECSLNNGATVIYVL